MPPDHHDEDKMLRPPHEIAMGAAHVRSERRGMTALAQQLVGICLSTVLLVAIVIVVLLTELAQRESDKKSELPAYLALDVSTTITIVRAMQGVLTALVAVTLAQSFSYLQWGFLRGSCGSVPYVRQLALSPTTSIAGTLSLVFHQASGWGPRFWGLLRLLLMLLAGLGGVVLFFRTSLIVVFDTTHSYAMTAGVGPFNASLVAPFFQDIRDLAPSYQFNTLPYSYYGLVNDLITNPFYTTTAEPVRCQAVREDGADDCAAYLMSGGLMLTAPWIPTGHPDHPQILMEKVPAIHIEFSALSAEKGFDDVSCRLFGSNATRIGVKLCLSQSGPTKLDAGMFICSGGVVNGQCKTADPAPNITTSFSFYRRSATVLGAKSNYTIISATNLTEPQPISFTSSDLEAYSTVLDWLLDYSKADIPAPSAIIEAFWSSKNQLQHPYTKAVMQRSFRSILTFPLWLFNANNVGNPDITERVISPNLPPDHYITASLVHPYTKIKFSLAMVAIFVLFLAAAIIFAWVVLLWAFAVRRSLPEISSFPMFDAEFKAEARGQSVPDARHMWGYRDKEILDAMSGAKIERRVI